VTVDERLDEGTRVMGSVSVRGLSEGDLAAIVKIDRSSTGRARGEYYATKVRQALAEQKLKMSLVAEMDGHVVGFLLARVFYGEFGQAEPVAVIDSVGVDPAFRKRYVGQTLIRQLVVNLTALRVERVETQVGWEQVDLLGFLSRNDFHPAARICLERRLD